jgi:hypothetical protein
MPDTPLPARPRPADGSVAPTADDRERVAMFLSERFADDTLTLEQFEDRVAAVYRVATRRELDALSADLVAPESPRSPAALRRAAVAVADTVPAHGRRFAVLSNLEQHNIAVAPRVLDVSTLLGNVELDLSGAKFGAGETEIHVNAIFGHIGIKLPSGAAVEQRGSGFLSSFECQPSPFASARRLGPKVVITGLAVFGAVEIVFGEAPATRAAGSHRLDRPRPRS